jgi:hypothetical protein
VALAGAETNARRAKGNQTPFTALDAARQMVAFRATAEPEASWRDAYRRGLAAFERRLK